MTRPAPDSPLQESGEGVFTASGPIVKLSHQSTERLTAALAQSAKGRVRICGHPDVDDRVHEMIIVLARGGYIQPHRHRDKSESFHIIEGELDIVVFDEGGAVLETIAMGPYGSDRLFFYRMNASLFHTVIVRTPHVIFHETTTGPFRADETEFASWAPKPDDTAAVAAFLARF
jgi:cupin fold WbuC family metalloprotein